MDVIIGVSGKAQAGKDTIANYLVKNYGFTRIALADSLKDAIQDIFDLSYEQLYDSELKEKELDFFPGWSPRKLLQYIGTDLLRKQLHEDIWIMSLAQKIKERHLSRVVIPDIRFPNERNNLEKYIHKPCYFIKVKRPGYDGNVGIKNHDTEKFDIHCNFIIDNNSTFESLHLSINAIMNTIQFELTGDKS